MLDATVTEKVWEALASNTEGEVNTRELAKGSNIKQVKKQADKTVLLLLELFGHYTVVAVSWATHTPRSIVGHAEAMPHLMSNGRGEAERVTMVILKQTWSSDAF